MSVAIDPNTQIMSLEDYNKLCASEYEALIPALLEIATGKQLNSFLPAMFAVIGIMLNETHPDADTAEKALMGHVNLVRTNLQKAFQLKHLAETMQPGAVTGNVVLEPGNA